MIRAGPNPKANVEVYDSLRLKESIVLGKGDKNFESSELYIPRSKRTDSESEKRTERNSGQTYPANLQSSNVVDERVRNNTQSTNNHIVPEN